MRRALVSVYDKTGLEELARGLAVAGIEIVSTGSTAKTIAAAGVAVTAVGDVTGFPETLDGRVKTLHPHIHGGLLADLRKDSHREQLENLGILAFELVVVNLYPFEQTVASGADVDECVEQIDIGGPAMVRASAKNYANVAIVTTPARYADVLDAVALGGFTLEQRATLAAEAFAHTATYDVAVASWLGSVVAPDPDGGGFPAWLGGAWVRGDVLRYGENPHQRAAVYLSAHHEPALAGAEQLQGKQMSYNNYVDADAARRAAFDHVEPAVAIIKHANPCGIAVGLDVAEAYRMAFATDPVSAFGGVVAANRLVTLEMAEAMAGVFTEVIVAPEYDQAALDLLSSRTNLRVLRVDGPHMGSHIESRSISGGLLLQVADGIQAEGDSPDAWQAGERRLGRSGDPEGPRVRLAIGAVGQVQRDPARQGRRGRRSGDGPGQPGRLGPARGRSRRRARGRIGRGLGCVLPVRGRAAGAHRRWRRRRRAAGRLHAGRGGHRGGEGGRDDDVLHGHPPLLPLMAVPGPWGPHRSASS